MTFSYNTGELAQIKTDFLELPCDSPDKADQFFIKHGKGNDMSFPRESLERYLCYRDLLVTIQKIDKTKYAQIHKGIPFYFLAWLLFDFGNIDSGLFFIDAAISEDIRKDETNWINNPAAKFLTLKESDEQVAKRTISWIENELQVKLKLFNNISNLPPILFSDFIDKFIFKLLEQKENRVIVSAFYAFLLKSNYLNLDLSIQNNPLGSSAQFLAHLFSGALIFESLCKIKYPAYKNSQLGDVFNDSGFKNNYSGFVFPSRMVSFQDVLSGNTLLNFELITTFTTIYKIRNSTAHNLVWDDTLVKENYSHLFFQELYAIFYFIQKEFC